MKEKEFYFVLSFLTDLEKNNFVASCVTERGDLGLLFTKQLFVTKTEL